MEGNRIVLVGLSGSGKSTVGRLIASQLDWDFVDTDVLLEAHAGEPIPVLFARDGEPAFRERERRAVAEAAARDEVVIATGGGAPTHPGSRAAIGRGFVAWLVVSPTAAAARLAANPESEERPLLHGDAAARLATLLAERRHLYELADAAVDVESLAPEQAAAEVIRLWREARSRQPAGRRRFGSDEELPPRAARAPVAATVRTAGAHYPVLVEAGLLGELGQVCRERGLAGRAFVVTDTALAPLFGETAATALRQAAYTAALHAIPPGEEHKTLATVGTLYDWLLSHCVERSDFVVALGGGVITDLAGFAAATCLRGIDFVHVPTTLLAMVDAAIGGKTGVDHPMGKNMIGAFAQPRAVLIDPAVLASLPQRQLVNGWAELVKHGLILDAALFDDLESAARQPGAMPSPELIARSVAIKAAVVSEDEREAGRRTLLNYGHTVGHAIEAVTGYTRYLHGEAVAIGMRVAGAISVELGLLSESEYARQQGLLGACGLPASAPGLDADAVLEATRSDKKVRDGRLRWVLLEGIGRAAMHEDVPPDIVRRAVASALQ